MERGEGGMGLMVRYYLCWGLRTHVSCVLLTRLGWFAGGTTEVLSQRYFYFLFSVFFSRTYAQTCIECTQCDIRD